MSNTNKNTVKFSIIIPTYNSENTLGITLESIQNQRWPSTEVIVIDGASHDDTVNIANSFKNRNITTISESDNGIYDAINKGIKLTTGDLICVLGSDDRLPDDTFYSVSRAWLSNPTDIVAGGALLESRDGKTTNRIDEPYGAETLINGIPFCHNSMYVTPKAYQKVGDYNLAYRICADAEWVHRSIRAGCTCSYIENPLVYFSLSGTSSMNDSLIMEETYAVISANFPGLSINDAKILFRAARRWDNQHRVADVLSRNRSIPHLSEVVNRAFNYSNDSESTIKKNEAQHIDEKKSKATLALKNVKRLLGKICGKN